MTGWVKKLFTTFEFSPFYAIVAATYSPHFCCRKITIMKKYLVIAATLFSIFSCSEKYKDELNGGGDHKDGTYFDITVDGVAMKLLNIHYARQGTTIHLATWGKNDFPNLNVTMTALNEHDFRGSYPYHFDMSARTSIVLYGIADGNGYESHWWDCPIDGPLLVASPGAVTIDLVERSNGNEYITGSFSTTQYQPQGNCPYVEVKEKKITGKFRLKKAQ